MNAQRRSAATILLPLLLAAVALPAPAQDASNDYAAVEAERTAQRESIAAQREALKAQRAHDEAACYQRFAVEDCLRSVRAGDRHAQARLRDQEILLNDAERKERASRRIQAIAEKQTAHPVGGAASAAPSTAVPAVPPPQVQQDQRAPKASAAEPQRGQADAQAQRAAERAERAAQARERNARALQAAQERRARVEKARADAAAAGRPPAQPLPARAD